MYKLIDTFKQTADTIAVLDRGHGIPTPDLQSTLEYLKGRIDATAPTLEIVSVKDFGAKGDGVADDTESIRNALNSPASIIFLPPGAYLVSDRILVPNGKSVVGSGINYTTIIRTNEEDELGILTFGNYFNNDPEERYSGGSLKDLTIKWNATYNTSQHKRGVVIRNINNFLVENVLFTDLNIGIRFQRGTGNRVINCKFYNCFQGTNEGGELVHGYGILCSEQTDLTIASCYFDETVMRHAIYLSGGETSLNKNVTIYGCSIKGNTNPETAPTGNEIPVKIMHTHGLTFIGNTIDGGLNSGIWASEESKNVTISGNTFANLQGAGIFLSYKSHITGITISNNVFDNCRTGIRHNGDYRITIVGNTIRNAHLGIDLLIDPSYEPNTNSIIFCIGNDIESYTHRIRLSDTSDGSIIMGNNFVKIAEGADISGTSQYIDLGNNKSS